MRRLALILGALLVSGPMMAEDGTLPSAITGDSEPGWRPTQDFADEAATKFGTVLHELGEGSYEQAYGNYDPDFRAEFSAADFIKVSAGSVERTGAMTSIRPVYMTWTKPKAGAALSGLYLSMDYTASFKKARRACGYVVMHQRPDDPNWYVMRTQEAFVTDASYDALVAQGKSEAAQRLWTLTKQRCPHVK